MMRDCESADGGNRGGWKGADVTRVYCQASQNRQGVNPVRKFKVS